MRKKIRDEEGPRDAPPIVTAPMIRELETDVRIRLRIDVSQLLQGRGVDSGTGEPSPEELHAYVITTIARFFRAKACVVEVHVDWLDIDYQVRALDTERVWP